MTPKSGTSFQKARDEAIRAIVSNCKLAPDQVSALKLDQVSLTTNTIQVEPDEFADPSAPSARSMSLKLDEETRRALIAWMVVRPDGPNAHLFPGQGIEGLDAATIGQVAAQADETPAPKREEKAPPKPETKPKREEAPPPPPERVSKKPTRRAASPEQRRPRTQPPRTTSPSAARKDTEPVSMDEIEALRRRLGDVYDDRWAPMVPSPEEERESIAPEEMPETEREEIEQVAPPPRFEETVVAKPTPAPERVPPARKIERPKEKARPEPVKKPRPPQEPAPAKETEGDEEGGLKGLLEASKKSIPLNLSYRAMALGGLALVIVCCVGFALAGAVLLRPEGLAGLIAGATPTPTPDTPTPTPTATPAPSPTATYTAEPSPTPSPTVVTEPTDEATSPAAGGPTPTPIVIVVTATPTPEPPATDTPVPTNTPTEAEAEEEEEPTATPTPAYKYPAPTLLEPEDGAVVPGRIAVLKWEPVGPLADDEWYSIRFVYLQQGELVYQGDRLKATEWRVPERFYYQADGPALEYRWYLFIERVASDGTATRVSPESETYVFRWE